MSLDEASEVLSVEEILELIRWIVEGPSYTSIPVINPIYSLGGRIDGELTRLREYLLETVIIKDNLGNNNDSRRAYVKDYPEIRGLYEKSKLRANRLLGCIYDMEEVMYGLRKDHSEVTKALKGVTDYDQIRQEIQLYQTRTLEEKIEFAQKIDDIVYRFLEVLVAKDGDK